MIGKSWAAAACAALLCLSSTPLAAQDRAVAPDPSLAVYGGAEHSVKLADGRTIHMVCMGQGAPTVVLTSGLGDWGVIWSKVQPAIARTTRVCAWDRPGFGFSSPSPQVQTVDNTTTDLEAALARGRIGGPYVLVGHSLGGYETLLMADRRPAEVAGLVLVDPSIPDQAAIMLRTAPMVSAASDSRYGELVASLKRCAADLRSGKVAAGKPDPDECLAQPPNYPAAMSQSLAQFQTNPALFDTWASLFSNFARDGELVVRPGRNYGDRPLIVLTAGRAEVPPGQPPEVARQFGLFQADWVRGHDQIAALSTRGENRVIPEAGHYIQNEKPEVVIQAIETVVAQVRAGPSRR